jgi:putative Mg2+ transporter-C (MgtC) family protein
MISWQEITIRVLLAAMFGAFIGLERERKDWAAGLRTHMMVSVGSCLIMIVSSFGFSDILGTPNVNLDPSRIAAQVVSGIGFLGAGAILFSKQGTIRGLTTAAGLWTVAAIGLATGSGLYFAAGSTTLLAIVILWGLQPIEKKFLKKFRHVSLRIVVNNSMKQSELLKMFSMHPEVRIQSFSCEREDETYTLLITFENSSLDIYQNIIDELRENTQVKQIHWNQ